MIFLNIVGTLTTLLTETFCMYIRKKLLNHKNFHIKLNIFMNILNASKIIIIYCIYIVFSKY